MDVDRFDRIARRFASHKPSSGASSPTDSKGRITPNSSQKIEFLFVQSFQSGSIGPVEGEQGRFKVKLEEGLGETIFFSDRPDRIVGTTPTDQFLEGLGFSAENPPNAALIVQTAPGETDIAVVELFNPTFDPEGPGVTYEIEVLANWENSLDLGFTESEIDLANVASSFGPAHLFIDDCPNTDIQCACYDHRDPNNPTYGLVLIEKDVGMCWNYSLCQPCEPYGHALPDRCATYEYWNQMCKRHRPGLECTPSWDWVMPPYCD